MSNMFILQIFFKNSKSWTSTLLLYILQYITPQVGKFTVKKSFLIWSVRLLALRPLLAYCASLGWQWRWLWRSRWNVDWQGKPKVTEKTCPSATFVDHKIPHDQTRVWTRAAAVGSRRLTAWSMARPVKKSCVFNENSDMGFLFPSFTRNRI
jgi:hypothetical protein